MKKLYTFYAFIIFIFVTPSFAMLLGEESVVPSVQQVDDTLFVAQVKEDLFFVMEKLDETNIAPWQEYVRLRYDHPTTKSLEKEIDTLIFHLNVDRESSLEDMSYGKTNFRYNTFRDYNNNPYYKKIHPLLTGDGGTFSRAVRRHSSLREKYPTNEVWIAYALSTRTAPTTKCTEETLQHIELSFSVNTDEESPFTTHMGIQRSLLYMKNYLEEELRLYRNPNTNDVPQFPWHGRTSVLLHAFAMKVISLKYPDKLYMITQPMREMRLMLLKGIPTEAIWLGSDHYHRMLEEDNDVKSIFWSDDEQKYERETKLYGPCVEQIWAKKYSPVSCTNAYFTTGYSGRNPRHWESEGIPEDFTWTLRDLDGNVAIHFDSSSLQRILERYQWFFMESHAQPSLDAPYVIVDLKKGSQGLNAQ